MTTEIASESPAVKEYGPCVAPGCEFQRIDKYRELCVFCSGRVKEAMIRAIPSLLELMAKDYEAEAMAWLTSPWEPPSRRWAILDEKHHEVTLDVVVESMVEQTTGGWSDVLGFMDDAFSARMEEQRQRREPESESLKPDGWRLDEQSPTIQAWRVHLTALLRPVLEHALATFPIRHAGYEIKTALVGQDNYGEDDFLTAYEDLCEGTGGWPISDGARTYLDLRFDTRRDTYLEPEDPAEYWWQYPVLAPEIMAILNAVKETLDT